MKFALGRKVKMSQIFLDDGRAESVTLIAVLPLEVTQLKTSEKDKYQAVQFGFSPKKRREWRSPSTAALADFSLGQSFQAAVFAPADVVSVSGISKGKGFQGVVKRHGFHGGPRTHGQKHSEREPGSIGGGLRTRVPKGMRMAGRMGGERVTVKNLRVLAVDNESNQLLVAGAVPGRRGTLLEIRG